MRRSHGKSTYQQRKRRGRKSNLYTRNRLNDPEPWAGTPPQTPPSSDDEGGCNENIIMQQQQRQRGERGEQPQSMRLANRYNKPLSAQTNVMRLPYKVDEANYSMTMRQSAAPVPTQQHQQQTNNRRRPLRTINNVKRNISKYVKMENANALQSRKQTAHIKTAPVPYSNNSKKSKSRQTAPVPLPPHLITAKLNKLKNMKQQQQKQLKSLSCSNNRAARRRKLQRAQKQTAPAPPPPAKRKSTAAAKSKRVTASAPINPNKKKMLNMNAKPFITNSSDSNDEIPQPQILSNKSEEEVDIRLIPDAYFIGDDKGISTLTFNSQTIKQINLDKDIDAILNFDVTVGTKVSDVKQAATAIRAKRNSKRAPQLDTANNSTSSNGSDEIRMHSPVSDTIGTATCANELTNYILSDFTGKSSEESGDEKKENEDMRKKRECDYFFNDDKFSLLAASILDDPAEHITARRPMMAINTTANARQKFEIDQFFQDAVSKQSTEEEEEKESTCSFYSSPTTKKNIWAEPSERKHQFVSRTTLSGLLSSGLPPISTMELFQ